MTESTLDIHLTIVLRNGRVRKAPSILHFMAMHNWSRDQVVRYCRERGWQFTIAEEKKSANHC